MVLLTPTPNVGPAGGCSAAVSASCVAYLFWPAAGGGGQPFSGLQKSRVRHPELSRISSIVNLTKATVAAVGNAVGI
jgi:hypothetical protein